jgi:uncharacterized protein YlzI (FlbEa/FlbD family)
MDKDMIKFINLTDAHLGNPVYLNPEWIVAVYPHFREVGGSEVTAIYGGPNGNVWYVEESLSEVIKLIDMSKNRQI